MRRASAAVAIAALLLACGESRQEKFEKAMRVAESAQKAVESAREDVTRQEARYEKARAAAAGEEKALEKARGKLESATSQLDAARAEVARWADDATVFRTVQQRLLEEKALANSAVSARVEQGVVSLEGTVPSDAARERALVIARETPGVLEVQSSGLVVAARGAKPLATPPPALPSDVPLTRPEAIEPAPVPIEPPAPAELPPVEPPAH